jgi:uncharacterized protein YaeQ
LSANKKVKVFHINVEGDASIEQLLAKTMQLSCVIEEDQMHLSDAQNHIGVQVVQSL